MEGVNEHKNWDLVKMHLHNKHWFIGSALFFIIAASVYLAFTPNKYRVQTSILIADKALSAESVTDNIKSKALVQRTLSQLPFQVNYYTDGIFKPQELYGDSLPVKLVFPKTAVDSSATATLRILSNQVFEIERDKVNMDFYFEKPVSYSFANFKGVKGPSFKTNISPISIKFNDPDELIEYYYDNLKVEPVDDKYLQLSILTTIPEKGVDFLNKLVEVYNKSNAGKSSTTIVVADNTTNLQAVKYQLATLKATEKRLKDQKIASLAVVKIKPTTAKLSKAQGAMDLTVLDAISPYVKRPVDQFVQIPYGDETDNKELEDIIKQFNKTQLDKQKLLQDSQANKSKIAGFNSKIAGFKVSILQKIDAQKDAINGIVKSEAPSTTAVAKINFDDSIARTAALIKTTQATYDRLLHTKPVTQTITTIIKPELTILEKPGESVVSYPRPALVYFLALLIGLILPLSLPYLQRLHIPVFIRFDFKKFNARIYELLHAKEID